MTEVTAFLQPGGADWEAASVLALLREHLGASVRIATVDGRPARSIGGVEASADLAFSDVAPDSAEVFLVIGSDAWPEFRDPGFFELLSEALASGRIVGAICAGTVPAARAGLFAGRRHTSNDGGWLLQQAPGYAGSELYVDQPAAVADGRLVSAAGLAPHTFAIQVAQLVSPRHADRLTAYQQMCAREFEQPPARAVADG